MRRANRGQRGKIDGCVISFVKNRGRPFDLTVLLVPVAVLVVIAVEFLNYELHISRVAHQRRRQAGEELWSVAREDDLVDLDLWRVVVSVLEDGIQVAAVGIVVVQSTSVVDF